MSPLPPEVAALVEEIERLRAELRDAVAEREDLRGEAEAAMTGRDAARVEVERLRERLACARAFDVGDGVGLYLFADGRWHVVQPDNSKVAFATLDDAWAALDAARKERT